MAAEPGPQYQGPVCLSAVGMSSLFHHRKQTNKKQKAAELLVFRESLVLIVLCKPEIIYVQCPPHLKRLMREMPSSLRQREISLNVAPPGGVTSNFTLMVREMMILCLKGVRSSRLERESFFFLLPRVLVSGIYEDKSLHHHLLAVQFCYFNVKCGSKFY